MQKVLLCLQRPSDANRDQWNTQVASLARARAGEFSASSYAVVDAEVEPAKLLEMVYTSHPKDALLTVWANSLADVTPLIDDAQSLGRLQAYSVMESVPIVFDQKPGRVEGMCQVAFIRKPESLDRPKWLQLWLGRHTQVAIDTQSTFGYRQNVVSVPLPLDGGQADWPLMHAVVEENFPAIAMTSREAFFDAEGDPDKFEKHQQIMLDSCMKFIDFENFDCVPMSQYVVK